MRDGLDPDSMWPATEGGGGSTWSGRIAAFRGVDEVAFSQSTDGGETWSEPVRVDRTPHSTNPLRQQAFVPSIAVTGDGSLVVTYYVLRLDRNGPFEATDHWALICRAGRDCSRRWSWARSSA